MQKKREAIKLALNWLGHLALIYNGVTGDDSEEKALITKQTLYPRLNARIF